MSLHWKVVQKKNQKEKNELPIELGGPADKEKVDSPEDVRFLLEVHWSSSRKGKAKSPELVRLVLTLVFKDTHEPYKGICGKLFGIALNNKTKSILTKNSK